MFLKQRGVSFSWRGLLLAAAFAVVGFILTREEFPELRVAQILMPLAWGAVAGLMVGRSRQRSGVLSQP